MESSAWILDDNNIIQFDQQNPIDKEDLIIEVLFTNFEEIILNDYDTKQDVNVSKAAIVPCSDPVLIFGNQIESVKVEIFDSNNNNTKIDITNQMVILRSEESIAAYISENNPDITDILIQFSDTTNIPDRITYRIEATLDDGLRISSTGGIINFN